MEQLPILLSIPHGGTLVPEEVLNHLAIGEREIFEDIDGHTREIYDLKNRVRHVIKADIARTFIDPGRAPSDLPPLNPDGVIKSHTCFGKTIFIEGHQPQADEVDSLLDKYYFPFHRRLRETVENNKNDLLLCVDCHSMAETGPVISPDRGRPRPLFCLGNRFGASSSEEVARKMKTCLVNAFEVGDEDVAINKPFAGGFITRHYGNKPVPWIQVEMNRKLYLRKPWFDPDTLELSKDRIDELNERFYRALKTFSQ